ncbi:unnamed protein product [Orchesella dallaii]|uniref:Uncharacterized protein n=1 Tax=Orchesella dallaii TaxID=48710 RepID=A0ABP1QEE9_9HEXA
MCCRCCTSLKVAGVWGSSIQMALGTILLLQFFILPEWLGEYYYFYLAYVSTLAPLGALIFLAILKEIGWLLKITSTLFILLQLYGLSIRLMLPMETTETFHMLRRILTLFFAIVLTAIYSFILILHSRKLTSSAAMSTTDSIGGEAGISGEAGEASATAL